MKSLPTTAPDVHKAFKDGKFTVRINPGKFNGVWSDVALEQTYNCEAKTNLFHGISQNTAAMMEKYLCALPMMTAVSEKMKLMTHVDQIQEKHDEDSRELGRKENQAIKRICGIIAEKMINPFLCDNTDLLNI